MRLVKIVGGILLILMGVVWMLQGFGASYVPTSFMTQERAVRRQLSAVS